MKKAYFLIQRNNGGAQRPRTTNQVNEDCEARRPCTTVKLDFCYFRPKPHNLTSYETKHTATGQQEV